MQPTRRYWATIFLAGFQALGAVVLGSPVLLVGAAVVLGWVVARQYRYVRALQQAVASLSIERTLSQSVVASDDTVAVALTVERPVTVLDLSVTASPPLSATGASEEARTVQFDESDGRGSETSEDDGDDIDSNPDTASTTFELKFPVAGEFEFGQPVLTSTESLGLFSSQVPVGATETLTVEPRAPRDMHVGEGGDQIASGLGNRTADRHGSGIEPETVRQYVPGDEVRRIDWKATARLNHPHVREFERRVDPSTILYVDHRGSMAAGPDGETKLDYAREVALAFVNSAHSLNSRLGLATVGDDGMTDQYSTRSGAEQYVTLRQILQGLRPTGDRLSDWRTRYTRWTPDDTHRAAARLADDGSPFGSTLAPFLDARVSYVSRVDAAPLSAAVGRTSAGTSDAMWPVIITDDSHPSDVREAVTTARRDVGNVMVFLTPSILFESGSLADLDAAYEAYTEFESFRRSLGRLEHVSAFEVAPGSKLATVLEARTGKRVRSTPRGESS